MKKLNNIRMSYEEICEKFYGNWVGLIEIERNDDFFSDKPFNYAVVTAYDMSLGEAITAFADGLFEMRYFPGMENEQPVDVTQI